MSRIGIKPVIIKDGITVDINGQTVTVKGPKGELKIDIHPKIAVKLEENELICSRSSENKEDKSLHGLSRSLLANMVQGVAEGFEKKLEINGVGYKANVQGNKVVLNLGFSHPIEHMIPEGVNIAIDQEKKNVLVISGIDKQKVGQVASEIRSYRPPEPYKGKGIKYIDEHIRRKAGKGAAGAKEA